MTKTSELPEGTAPRVCPFCGVEPKVCQNVFYPTGEPDPNGWFVNCNNGCDCLPNTAWAQPSREAAVAAWNNRPVEDNLARQVTQLEAQLAEMRDEATFLCARLREIENELDDDDTGRQFCAHVVPSLARMEDLLTQAEEPKT